MKAFKLGIALGAAMLAGVGVAQAQQIKIATSNPGSGSFVNGNTIARIMNLVPSYSGSAYAVNGLANDVLELAAGRADVTSATLDVVTEAAKGTASSRRRWLCGCSLSPRRRSSIW